MNRKFALLTAVLAIAVTSAVAGMNNPMVGGQEMYPTKNIIQNAVNSADHTTLVAAVKAAGLVETLEGAGPFTVFAPTNEAFAKLPAGTVDTLLKPENKPTLTQSPDLPRSGRQAERVGFEEADQSRQRHRGTHHGRRRQALGLGRGQSHHAER